MVGEPLAQTVRRAPENTASRRFAFAGKQSSRRLRVLVLNERCHANPLAGGVEAGFFERYGRIAGHEVDVELLCAGFPGSASHDVHQGVRISRVGTRLSYYARVVGEVRRRVRAGQVDVVVEELSKVPFLSPLYARVPVVAVHHHLHGMTAFRQVSPLLASSAVALESLLPWVYRNVPFLTVSQSSRSDLLRRGLSKSQVELVFNGIDHDTYRPAPLRGRDPWIVSVGRLEPYKRVDLLIRAMPHVLRTAPSARLVILGRGQEESRLRSLTARLGLTQQVVFAGYTSDAQKVAWMQAARVHVQCSSKEGWGLTVTEAYACGTPVVATDSPGLRDSVKDGVTGLLVRESSATSLALAVSRLMTHEDERVAMAQRALSWSEHFTWKSFAGRLELMIRRAATRGESVPVVSMGWGEPEVAA